MNIFNILALSVLQGYLLVKIKAIWLKQFEEREEQLAKYKL
jgi:predicted membrane protein